ncbi:Uncharacterised protein [uncultured archaeon]|nr:Uncharacterised protein [uncultured archaeon]
MGMADYVQAFRYGNGGWQPEGEYLNASSGASYGIFVGVADLDNDSGKEALTLSLALVGNESGSAQLGRMNVFEYNPEMSRFDWASANEIKPANLSEENEYEIEAAALGDYDGDGYRELAVNFYNYADNNDYLGVYAIRPFSLAAPASDEPPAVEPEAPADEPVAPDVPVENPPQPQPPGQEPPAVPGGQEPPAVGPGGQNPPAPEPPSQPEGPAVSPENAAAASQAGSLISELETKIAIAKGQGLDTKPLQDSLDRAKQLQQQGKYVEAALEAQNGVNNADNALPPKPPQDYTLYIIAGVALIVIAGIALLAFGGLLGLGGLIGGLLLIFGRKPKPPPEPNAQAPAAEVPAQEPKAPAPKGKRRAAKKK